MGRVKRMRIPLLLLLLLTACDSRPTTNTATRYQFLTAADGRIVIRGDAHTGQVSWVLLNTAQLPLVWQSISEP